MSWIRVFYPIRESGGIMSGTKGKIHIRPLKVTELEDMRRVWTAAGLPYKPGGRDSPQRLVKQLKDKPTLFIGAFSDGKLVGVSLCSDDGRKGWINRLAVLPEFTGKGIATSLITQSEKALRRRGIHIFCIHIEGDNESSMRLFEKAEYHREKDISYYTKRERDTY
jgi:ribosomal protein S18 acetylase RimI-like enzyme